MDDWEFCKHNLIAVSRTFSRPIEMLPPLLERAVTCGYLLCRLADTIEDHPTLPMGVRDRLYASFLSVVEAGGPAEAFVEDFGCVTGQSDEFDLARNLPRVMRVFRALPPEMQDACTPWVCEMARGMQVYSHRPAGPDGFQALLTVQDLERYCFFVAGTVGHLLTELFVAALPELSERRTDRLRRDAEAFGLGLQLVNILKDVTDDRERRVSFIPRSACADAGLTIETLTAPERRADAHRALAPIFERAHHNLDRALEYCLALPPEAREIRLFCLLPLWMAIRTLVVAKNNDDQFIDGRSVKITREEVGRVIADCVARCQDDESLREGYARLSLASPT